MMNFVDRTLSSIVIAIKTRVVMMVVVRGGPYLGAKSGKSVGMSEST